MMVNDAMGSGARIIQIGMNRLESAAQDIAVQSIRPVDPIGQPSAGQSMAANRPVPQGNLVEPLVEQQRALYEARAGVKVIEVADKTLGALLNVFV